MLEGRAAELNLVDARLAAGRRGESFALLAHGEPGIGKSALLDEVARRADGFRVLQASGRESESALPFAVLHELVGPVMSLDERLPAAQTAALRAALGGAPDGPRRPSALPPDRFAVAVSLLALLSEAALAQPLLILVDDLQWLDPASRDALLFVARRLGPGGIGLLLALRDDDRAAADTTGLERVALGPLDDRAARAVLARVAPALPRPVAERVIELAAGNALALTELPATLSDDQRAGRAPLGGLGRPGPRFEQAFARRFGEQPPHLRLAIATAAAMEHGTVAWLLAALRTQGIAEATLDDAERERALVVREGTVGFRHPLLRAAAYHAVSPVARAAAHRALAATAPDPRRRAWQIAAAVGDAADDDAATALEAAAEHARAVGGHAEAASAFARAAELSREAGARGLRELAAAQALAVDGQLDRALALLEAAERDAGASVRLAAIRLRGNLAMRRGDPHAAGRLLLDEADRRQASGEHEAAAQLYLEAAVAPMMTGDVDEQERIVTHARAAASSAGGPLAVLADLVAGEVLAVRGRDVEADAALEAAAARLDEVDLVSSGEIVAMAAQTSMWIGSDARADRIVAAMLATYEQAGALGRVPYPLSVRAQLAFRRGHWEAAAADAAAATSLARDSGQQMVLAFTLAVLARVLAWTGRDDAARAAIAEALAIAESEQAAGIAVHAHVALADAELLAGHPEKAIASARRADELERERGLWQLGAGLWAGTLVEALVESGDVREAAAELDALDERARAGGSAYGRAVVARGRVLLAEADEVDERSATAQSTHASVRMPLEQARTELALGERLRRLGRRPDARPHLIAAAAAFGRLGAAPSAARARAALDAGAPDVTVAVLTVEEQRIARLVAAGLTNREIAGELYVSEKTVERRLSVLYRRLRIKSRVDLVRLLGER